MASYKNTVFFLYYNSLLTLKGESPRSASTRKGVSHLNNVLLAATLSCPLHRMRPASSYATSLIVSDQPHRMQPASSYATSLIVCDQPHSMRLASSQLHVLGLVLGEVRHWAFRRGGKIVLQNKSSYIQVLCFPSSFHKKTVHRSKSSQF